MGQSSGLTDAILALDPAELAALVAQLREETLAAFAARDAQAMPAPGGIVFVGSSIFAQWPDVTHDMSPLPVFNRAISGSTTAVQLEEIERLVFAYRPAIVVFYAGSNDIAFGASADAVIANVQAYAEQIYMRLPQAQFVFASINRAPQKREKWALVEEANGAIRAEAAGKATWFTYVDVNKALEDERGEPLPGLYLEDGLHFRPSAYARFAEVIRPVLQRIYRPAGTGETR